MHSFVFTRDDCVIKQNDKLIHRLTHMGNMTANSTYMY